MSSTPELTEADFPRVSFPPCPLCLSRACLSPCFRVSVVNGCLQELKKRVAARACSKRLSCKRTFDGDSGYGAGGPFLQLVSQQDGFTNLFHRLAALPCLLLNDRVRFLFGDGKLALHHAFGAFHDFPRGEF